MKSLAILMIVPIAVPAFAQTSQPISARVEIVGEAPAACVMKAPTVASGLNATFTATSGTTGEIRISELVDPITAQPEAAELRLAIPVICNAPHRLVMRSGNGGLLRQGGTMARQGAFAQFLTYRFGAAWANRRVTRGSDIAGQLVINADSARSGDVILSFNVDKGETSLVAGTYSDQIIIEFQAAN
jgi:hypothetical protein